MFLKAPSARRFLFSVFLPKVCISLHSAQNRKKKIRASRRFIYFSHQKPRISAVKACFASE